MDANEHIASGHVMRCLSIADALFDLGETVVFFTSDAYAEEIIIKRGFKTVRLDSEWEDKEGELEGFIKILNIYKPELLIIDSYQVTQNYLKILHDNVKIAYIDDLNAFDYPVDMVINYSIYAEEMNYPGNKTYLLGTKYVPLRKQFSISTERLNIAIKSRKSYKQILITTGASDPFHVAEQVVGEVLKQPELSEYRIAVVKGRFCNRLSFSDTERVIIYENVQDMADLMLDSCVSVSAGGSTLYELCACCVPTVTISYADNQLANVNGFEKRSLMAYAGDARLVSDIGKRIVDIILNYSVNDGIINSIEQRMLSMDCRNGAKKLAYSLVH